MQTKKYRVNPVLAGATVMFALFFMAVTTIRAIVGRTVSLDDVIIVLVMMIATESTWWLIKTLKARGGSK